MSKLAHWEAIRIQGSRVRMVQVVYALCMGGSEMLARRIAGALNEEGGYACSVYAINHGGPMAEVLAAERIPFQVFSRYGKLDLRLIRQLSAQFRADKVKVVHTHHLCELLYGGIAARLAGARVVHTEHEVYSLSRRRARWLLRVLSTVADVVTAVSQPVMEFLRDQVGIPEGKLKTISNGVDIPRFQSAHPTSRSSFGWGNEDVVIGCVARLEPEKRHDLLLEAFRQVHKKQQQARLLLIGDGGEKGRLIEMVNVLGLNGSVRFLGIRGDIPELLAACDVLALASSREGLPMVVLEAMAAGKPVVATRVGSVPDVVKDGRTGLLVSSGSTHELAHALAVMIRDAKKRQEFGAEAFKLVQTEYSFDRTLELYKDLYMNVLIRPGQG